MLIVFFQGGFANQLFQYALYLKLNRLFPSETILADASHYGKNPDHGGFKLDRVGIKLNYYRGKKAADSIKGCKRVTEKNYDDFIDDYSKQKGFDDVIVFVGYWQEDRYFSDEIEEIKLFFSTIALNERNDEYLRLINSSESVAIHVRRGDYVNNHMHGNIANKTYYQNAIDFVSNKISEPTFFVFSDDIEWCKNSLLFPTEPIFVEGNENAVENDILLMSRCKHNIISNSSFSWWGQTLNQNENKIVCIPPRWLWDEEEFIPLKVGNAVVIDNYKQYEKRVSNPFFSILIPAYNNGPLVERCLLSILEQTFSDYEIVIVDDASTDNTRVLIEKYVAVDNRIAVIKHSENRGLLSARISAMKKSSGKYTIFLDSDGYFSEDALSNLYGFLFDRNEDIIRFQYIQKPQNVIPVIDDSGIDKGMTVLSGHYPPMVWNKCYSAKLIRRALEFIEDFRCTFGEDVYFSTVFFTLAESFVSTDIIVHYFMTNIGDCAGRGISYDIVRDSVESIKNLTKKIKNLGNVDERLTPEVVDESAKRASADSLVRLLYNSNVEAKNLFRSLILIDEELETDYCEKFRKVALDGYGFYSVNFARQIKRLCVFFMHKLYSKFRVDR